MVAGYAAEVQMQVDAEKREERLTESRMPPDLVWNRYLTAALVKCGRRDVPASQRVQLPWGSADHRKLRFMANSQRPTLVIEVMADVAKLLRGVPDCAALLELKLGFTSQAVHVTTKRTGPAQPRYYTFMPLHPCDRATIAVYREHTKRNEAALESAFYFDLTDFNL
jgi:hypothetical protein